MPINYTIDEYNTSDDFTPYCSSHFDSIEDDSEDDFVPYDSSILEQLSDYIYNMDDLSSEQQNQINMSNLRYTEYLKTNQKPLSTVQCQDIMDDLWCSKNPTLIYEFNEEGYDIARAKDSNNNTFLMISAFSSRNMSDLIFLLIQCGTDLNYQDNNGMTALMKFVSGNKNRKYDLTVIKTLVESGAIINIRDRTGKTALTYSKRNKHNDIEIIEYLIKMGALE